MEERARRKERVIYSRDEKEESDGEKKKQKG